MVRNIVHILVFLSCGFLSAMQAAKQTDCRLRTAGYLAILVEEAERSLREMAPDQNCGEAVASLAALRTTLNAWNDRQGTSIKGLSNTPQAWILEIVESYAVIPTFNPDCETWKRMAALDILGEAVSHLPVGSKEQCPAIIGAIAAARRAVHNELHAIVK